MLDKIKWFWRYYKHFPWVLFVLIVFTPVQAILFAYLPRLLQFSIDYIKTGQTPDSGIAKWIVTTGEQLGMGPDKFLPLSFILLGVISFCFYAFVQGHRAWMNRRLDWAFRQYAFDNTTEKGPDFFNKFRTGDLVTRLTDDIEGKLSWFACSGIFRLYEAIAMVIFTLIMMININPWLTAVTAIPLPVMIFIFFKYSKLLHKRYDTLQTTISNFQAVMESCFSGIRVVKAYVQEKAQRAKLASVLGIRRTAEIDTVRSGAVVDSMYMYIWQLGLIIVLLGGGQQVMNQKLTVGELFAFVYYVVYLFYPMFDVGQFFVRGLQSGVSIDRLVELERMPVMVSDNPDGGETDHIKGQLSFENVSFTFPGLDRNIISDISFNITTGQTIALVGKVGSGKSWLINMIPRLVDPTGGKVKLDGRDLREFRLEDLRRNIGYVPQEPLLFSDTIRNNIRFGRENISDDILNWALDVSQLKDEVAQFPKGLETQIGTRGMSISGGQKQRLSLARALAGKPKILILDDCTSALDSRTESALWNRLHEVMPGMTAIIITHRPDTLERVDFIYVLEEGKIIESGTHHTLISQSGHYSRIYRRLQLEEQVGA